MLHDRPLDGTTTRHILLQQFHRTRSAEWSESTSPNTRGCFAEGWKQQVLPFRCCNAGKDAAAHLYRCFARALLSAIAIAAFDADLVLLSLDFPESERRRSIRDWMHWQYSLTSFQICNLVQQWAYQDALKHAGRCLSESVSGCLPVGVVGDLAQPPSSTSGVSVPRISMLSCFACQGCWFAWEALLKGLVGGLSFGAIAAVFDCKGAKPSKGLKAEFPNMSWFSPKPQSLSGWIVLWSMAPTPYNSLWWTPPPKLWNVWPAFQIDRSASIYPPLRIYHPPRCFA